MKVENNQRLKIYIRRIKRNNMTVTKKTKKIKRFY